MTLDINGVPCTTDEYYLHHYGQTPAQMREQYEKRMEEFFTKYRIFLVDKLEVYTYQGGKSVIPLPGYGPELDKEGLEKQTGGYFEPHRLAVVYYNVYISTKEEADEVLVCSYQDGDLVFYWLQKK